eukprot:4728736-Alexandrium_andersonii.AAC.1
MCRGHSRTAPMPRRRTSSLRRRWNSGFGPSCPESRPNCKWPTASFTPPGRELFSGLRGAAQAQQTRRWTFEGENRGPVDSRRAPAGSGQTD